ncbi:MAG: S-adenosylmethionine:tRNA ribosyltransferase-isomerase [Bacteroidales bacterium]|nr:S-adenosylmethionine:tRNA ribosyltransferase-isomerase [Bacteroidales bacterium]
MEKIKIEDFNYHLPSEKIALFPHSQRENSKLLIFKNQHISEDSFIHISHYLPKDTALVFNNTKVIHARMMLQKPTGAFIEIFCLKPVEPNLLHEKTLAATENCVWECLIGNNKRFKEDLITEHSLGNEKITLTTKRLQKEVGNTYRVMFSWTPAHYSFSEVLEAVGKVPLPPYIKRSTVPEDAERYQTVYATEKGSVAAPTAGLHFTEAILQDLKQKNIPLEYITLHVGAGTFKPVSEEFVHKHTMHEEALFFTKQNIENLLNILDKRIVCVGTTTVRSLESLYWMGVKLYHYQQEGICVDDACFHLSQWEAYQTWTVNELPPRIALQTLLGYLEKNKLDYFYASTQLMIVPQCYKLRLVKGIITNFHQPQSTLLLLIAAFVGDQWKDIYTYALQHNFRFLSYGDACLFL